MTVDDKRKLINKLLIKKKNNIILKGRKNNVKNENFRHFFFENVYHVSREWRYQLFLKIRKEGIRWVKGILNQAKYSLFQNFKRIIPIFKRFHLTNLIVGYLRALFCLYQVIESMSADVFNDI